MEKGIPFYQVNPIRLSKNITISKYTRSQAFECLLDSLLCNRSNETMYWVSEILCSGYIEKLWIFSFEFFSMYIHVFYPTLIVYIKDKYDEYKIIRKNNKKGTIHNNIKIREYFFRIFYIFSVVNKKFLIKLFHSDIFKTFDTLYDCHKALVVDEEVLMKNITEKNADEIIQIMSNTSKNEIDNALSQMKQAFAEFIRSYEDENDKTKFVIYNWLSVLLEKGSERFNLYHNNQNNIHIKHCQSNQKHSYFIWIIWNILLEHHKRFPIWKEIMSLYRIYESYKLNQSTNAYMLIILAYILCLEKIPPKKINLDNILYNDCKVYFYNTFGYIKESITLEKTRKDKI